MQMQQYEIRPEKPEEWREVEALTREAFWNVYRPGCMEHYILHRFRSRPDFIPSLSLVLEAQGRIVAHIMYCRAGIACDDGRKIPLVCFGPVSVLPAWQRQGYGSALIRDSLERAGKLGFGAVAITGDPCYYARFGFVDARSLGVYYGDMPRGEETPFFMLMQLKPGWLDGVTGVYHESDGYQYRDEDVEAFDAGFPPREKQKLPGQLV